MRPDTTAPIVRAIVKNEDGLEDAAVVTDDGNAQYGIWILDIGVMTVKIEATWILGG
jgi:hypothetical protein